MKGFATKYRQRLTPNIKTVSESGGRAVDLFFTKTGLCAEHFGASGYIHEQDEVDEQTLLSLIQLYRTLCGAGEKSVFISGGAKQLRKMQEIKILN